MEDQALALQKRVRSPCTELRTAIDIREGMLMSQLEQMCKQKQGEMLEKGQVVQDHVARLRDLCGTLSTLLRHEPDPNVFMAQIALPEMEISELLQQDLKGMADGGSLGLELDIRNALEELQLLDFQHEPVGSKAAAPSDSGLGTPSDPFHEQIVPYRFSLVLDMQLSEWLADPMLQSSVKAMVAAHAGVPGDSCQVLYVRAGSCVVDFEIVCGESVAEMVFTNLKRLFSTVQEGAFHLHGVKARLELHSNACIELCSSGPHDGLASPGQAVFRSAAT